MAQPERVELDTIADVVATLGREVIGRIERIAEGPNAAALAAATALIVESVANGGVLQAFGTGHSEAFAMEIAGRAGGLIPTNRIALRDVVLHGDRDVSILTGSALERDGTVVEELIDAVPLDPADVFLIASNSGVNGSIVEMALQAKRRGHAVIGVTSLEHTNAVEPKHPSGQRLSEIADVVIDNLAPFGDATIALDHGIAVGAVSSLTAAFVAQILTVAAAQQLTRSGVTPPVYMSANVPGGDEHNSALEDRYRERIRRMA